jgi:hypothetical protein
MLLKGRFQSNMKEFDISLAIKEIAEVISDQTTQKDNQIVIRRNKNMPNIIVADLNRF